MSIFLKAISFIIISLLLYLIIGKERKEFTYVLTVGTCCTVLLGAASYYQTAIQFFEKIQSNIQVDDSIMPVIMKVVLIGIVAELTEGLCADVGNATLGKVVHLLAISVMISISIPLVEALLALINDILVIL